METKKNNENVENKTNTTKRDEKQLVSKDKLLEYGVYFGHKTQRWDPRMKPFIHGVKNGTHILNLSKIYKSLVISYDSIYKIAKNSGTFLFVGTNQVAKNTIKENAIRTKSFFMNERWLGGTLTNFKTIQQRIKRMRFLEKLSENNFEGYSKKEGIKLSKELQKLEKNLGGIKHMRNLPSAIIVSSVVDEAIVIKEAKKMDIPVFGIVDSNANPREIPFPIIGNDDANKSVSLIITLLADAIAEGKDLPLKVAKREEIEVLGLKTPNTNDGQPRREFVKREPRREEQPKKVEEPKKVEPKVVEEPKKVEPKKEAPKKEEPKKVEPKNDKELEKLQREKELAKQQAEEARRQVEEAKAKIREIEKAASEEDLMKNTIEIKGVGPKISAYFETKGIANIKDIISIDVTNKEFIDDLIEGIPGLKSETIFTKTKKFDNFIEQARKFVSEK